MTTAGADGRSIWALAARLFAAAAFLLPAAAGAQAVTQAEQDVVVALNARFFASWNDGDPAELRRRFFSEGLKAKVSDAQWADVHRRVRSDAGRVVAWRFPKVTWYDLQARVGRPGLAAAIDHAGRTEVASPSGANAAKYVCGYTIWDRIGEGRFELSRFEFGVYDPVVAERLPLAKRNQLLAELKCPFRLR